MNRPPFLEGAVLAMIAAIGGGVFHTLASVLLPMDLALRFLIAAVSLGYILYLLYRSREPLGRPTTLMIWMLVALPAFLLPSLILYVLLHVGILWLVRSLYFHNTLLAALLDLMLCAAALAAAAWALQQSASISAAIWCFFLTQALFASIPSGPGHRQTPSTEVTARAARFSHALAAAESALHKLSSTEPTHRRSSL